jgi:hypothetical protein
MVVLRAMARRQTGRNLLHIFCCNAHKRYVIETESPCGGTWIEVGGLTY